MAFPGVSPHAPRAESLAAHRAKDEKGRTPLDLAKERKDAAAVQLLEAGK